MNNKERHGSTFFIAATLGFIRRPLVLVPLLESGSAVGSDDDIDGVEGWVDGPFFAGKARKRVRKYV